MVDDEFLMEEERDIPEFHFADMSDEEKQVKISELIRKRDDILSSLGYSFDAQGNIISRNTQMSDGILGFAVADALGVPAEASSREALDKNPVTDMTGYGRYDVPEGTWSDDTSMMLATMDSLFENMTLDYKDMMHKFVEWTDTAKYTATGKVFDVGVTTRRALYRFKRYVKPLNCGGFDYKDNGNGSLMRMLPIAYYLASNNFPEDREVAIVSDVSSLTHAHYVSQLGCLIYCDFVKQLLKGSDKNKALEYLMNKDYEKYFGVNIPEEYDRILSGKIASLSRDEISSSGYVVDTLEASLWATLTSDNYEEAVLKAVNLGRDTDTIGALTGGLNGIIYGKKQIPDRWLSKMRNLEYLEEVSNNFTDMLRGMVSQEKLESDQHDLEVMLQESDANVRTEVLDNPHK